jgi:ABC-type Na+ transport system ATPase subunit NatA
MLERLKIKNFRSCKDITLDGLGPVTALVGWNAAGKSNILKAVEWFARTATGNLPSHRIFIFGESSSASAEIVLKKKRYFYSIQIDFVRSHERPEVGISLNESLFLSELGREDKQQVFSRKGTAVTVSSIKETLTVGPLASCLPTFSTLFPASTELVKLTNPLLQFLRRIRYYPLDEPTDSDESNLMGGMFVTDEEYKQWRAKYEQTGDPGGSVVMRLLHMSQVDKDRFEEFVNMIGSNGLGLIDRVYIAPHTVQSDPGRKGIQRESQQFYYIAFHPSLAADNPPSHLFGYSNLSVGTRRTLRVLASLLFDENTVMLIEHPEDGIHAGLVRKLTSMIQRKSDRAQVIMSSHSSTVLNTLTPPDIRLVTMQKGETKVRSLSPQERALAQEYIAEQGPLANFIRLLTNE